MSTGEEKHCAHCGKQASHRCLFCVGAPEYKAGDAVETMYCNKRCQKKGWVSHKYRCKKLQKRIALCRVGKIMEAVALAYREHVFPVNYKAIEMRDGVLCFDFDPYAGPKLGKFPEGLTSDKNLRKAALLNNMCVTVLHLLSPLAKHFFPAFRAILITTFDVIATPFIPIQLTTNYDFKPLHTILKVSLEEENWALDITARQFGYPEIVQPWDDYLRQKMLSSKSPKYMGIYHTHDIMGDLVEILEEPGAMSQSFLIRHHTDCRARMHFVEFAYSRFNERSAKDFLSGSDEVFQKKVDELAGEVKELMAKFMEDYEQVTWTLNDCHQETPDQTP
ncbi:hypothetical protein GGR53DRAFT_465772 [Hypoxylon sp. FL1150]|nr:hypothetical protein GGR53DRAFT_465772 [Hypoxylon sp. FL1150]